MQNFIKRLNQQYEKFKAELVFETPLKSSVKAMYEIAIEELHNRRLPIHNNHIVAALLSPRTVNSESLNTYIREHFYIEFDLINDAYLKIKNKLETSESIESELLHDDDCDLNRLPEADDNDLSILSLLQNDHKDHNYNQPRNDEEEALRNEWNSYKTANKSFNQDPSSYWKANKHIFPKLSIVATHVFSISATSTSPERVFSHSGATLRKNRLNMSKPTLEKLVFAHENVNRL